MTLSEYATLWSRANDAYKGIGGFADGSYLIQYPRETEDKFNRRKAAAYYTNLIASNVERYIGYIYRNPPTRSTQNDMIRAFFDDCTGRGDHIDIFMSDFAKAAKVRGVGAVLVDMPAELPQTKAEQIEQRAYPYLKMIPPENITGFKFDDSGQLEWISFTDTLDLSTPDTELVIPVTYTFTKTSWMRDPGNTGEHYARGDHNLGICPVVLFSETGEFPDIGEFTQAVNVAVRLYNAESELDEILRGQTFSVLTIQTSDATNAEGITLSSENAITYEIGAERPQFIAPPDAPAAVYLQKIEQLKNTIDRLCLNISTNQAIESGIALELKFQNINASLSNFAKRLHDFERRVLDVVRAYLRLENDDTAVSYTTDFNIIDAEKELRILEEFKTLGYDVPTYELKKLERFIAADLGTLTPEELAQIREEIKNFLIAEASEQPPDA